MSQTLQALPPKGFVLVPVRVLPVQQEDVLAAVMQAYERALDEVRAVSRPAIMERLFAASWN